MLRYIRNKHCHIVIYFVGNSTEFNKFLMIDQWKKTFQNKPRYQFLNTIFQNFPSRACGAPCARTTLKTFRAIGADEVPSVFHSPPPFLQPLRCPCLLALLICSSGSSCKLFQQGRQFKKKGAGQLLNLRI